ncbi:Uncharacterised protein [Sphingobacterium mizutaii]|uniref:Uncharacterized protein n=1 Tax=Sphingobacterium mizutaii TaxID=1010 RepID=A0AAJ5C0U0_9SPHI|nr:hypothetical protein SAMN05192578_1011330 [Sphingobacterium mizutaii]SNV51552.1 Uncharacterised protein [Sphingobacterium mizutaii]
MPSRTVGHFSFYPNCMYLCKGVNVMLLLTKLKE